MSDALEEYDGKVRIGGRNIINLRFVDDKYALAKEKQDREAQAEIFDKSCTMSNMDVSAERTNWCRGYKNFSCSTQLSMNFFLLINVKMPTIVKT